MKIRIVHCLFTIASVRNALCSIAGISYMDPLDFRPLPPYKPGEDPCNPLYWYLRQRPAYCDIKLPPPPLQASTTPCPLPSPPIPIPIPIPLLPAIPIPMPVPMPMPMPQPYCPPAPIMPQPYGPPAPMMPQYYPPAYPNPMMPVYPYPPQYRQQVGMVPGIPGMVSRDGGINILPFSDAYSDLLEKHKQKMIRKRLERVLDDYEDFPNSRRHKKLRKYRKSLDS